MARLLSGRMWLIAASFISVLSALIAVGATFSSFSWQLSAPPAVYPVDPSNPDCIKAFLRTVCLHGDNATISMISSRLVLTGGPSRPAWVVDPVTGDTVGSFPIPNDVVFMEQGRPVKKQWDCNVGPMPYLNDHLSNPFGFGFTTWGRYSGQPIFAGAATATSYFEGSDVKLPVWVLLVPLIGCLWHWMSIFRVSRIEAFEVVPKGDCQLLPARDRAVTSDMP